MSFSGDLFWDSARDFGRSMFLGEQGAFMTSENPDINTFIVFTKKSEEKDQDPNSVARNYSGGILGHLVSPIRQVVKRVIDNPMFHCMNQTNVHTFVHEVSHGLAERFFSGHNPQVITVYVNNFTGSEEPRPRELLASWKNSVIYVAGPMGNMALCTCKLVAAQALQNSICWPVSVVLGGSAVINMIDETGYACRSVLAGDDGDFGLIRQNGAIHLVAAGAAFAAQGAFALMTAAQLVF